MQRIKSLKIDFFNLPPEQWFKLHYDRQSPNSIVDAVLRFVGPGKAKLACADLHSQSDRISKFIFDSNQFEHVGDSLLVTKACVDCTLDSNKSVDDLKEVIAKVDGFLVTNADEATQNIKHREIVQHLAAYAQIYHSSLDGMWSSVDGIKDLHRILTAGLEHADPDAAVEPGHFRSTARHAIGVGQRLVIYMDPAEISSAMDEFVNAMQHQLQHSCALGPNPQMFLLIANIFYKFLLIHPFGDGNGRMARLLANHVLILHGVTLPVSFVAGKHKRGHAHYSQVLDRAQHKDNNPSRLATFAAEMVNQTYSSDQML